MGSQDSVWPLRFIVLVAYCGAMIAATHWPNLNEGSPLVAWAPSHTDKLVHLALYVGWAVVWWHILIRPDRPIAPRALVGLFMLGAIWAATDEVTQGWVGRRPSWGDFAADLVGIGLALSVLAVRHQRRFQTWPCAPAAKKRSIPLTGRHEIPPTGAKGSSGVM